jgi:cyclopropane fatty-acyl-phospholipid synthase-like methyltransferase
MCCKLEKEHGLTLDASRLKSLRAILVHADLNKIFDLCQIFYHAPADATQTGLPTQSVDLVYSNNTLEHISKPVLEGLFQEAHRLLRRKGVMMHHIDLTDHYSHQDASITSINFLHFTETEFRKYNNRFIYQNRLRPNHYRELIERAGFRVVAWSVDVNERAMQPFSKKLLAAPYDQLSREEICAARVRVVAERL